MGDSIFDAKKDKINKFNSKFFSISISNRSNSARPHSGEFRRRSASFRSLTHSMRAMLRLLFVGDVYTERAIRGRGGYAALARVLGAQRANVPHITLGTGCVSLRA